MSDRPLSAEEIKAMNPDEMIKLLYELKLELARLRSQAKICIPSTTISSPVSGIVKRNIPPLLDTLITLLRLSLSICKVFIVSSTTIPVVLIKVGSTCDNIFTFKPMIS